MNNVMLDLETMGNSSNSAIISIGAVHFAKGEIIDRFYEKVALASSVKFGLEIDPNTVMWWMKQSDDARKQFDEGSITLPDALNNFTNWIGEDAKVWGNGAAFDNVILSNAYKKVGFRQPWEFWNDRCYRTIKSLCPEIKMEKRNGVYHCAVDDAENQAIHLMLILSLLVR